MSEGLVRWFENAVKNWRFITGEIAKIKIHASVADLNEKFCQSYI